MALFCPVCESDMKGCTCGNSEFVGVATFFVIVMVIIVILLAVFP